ncbi:TonB-dependent receptor [Arcticibacter tournemirensis]|uniref:TonB-dependent receptor n=1 Tax=Arcticibacter tournemirensis TaxID=699437 RepID=UPI001F2CACB4|nr:TonB-dependent receptor [Arcticibacter tournemirensis]
MTTSSITGSVRDSKGEPLIGATVKATHQPTGTVYGASTNSEGHFSIPNMRSGGPYRVEVSYIGYQSRRIDNVLLKLGEPYVLNVNVSQAGTELTEVSVTATDPRSVLNADRSGSTTNISTREIQTLPTISRSINDLTRLTPQANGNAIGGGNYRQNNITVDGSSFNNSFGIGSNLPGVSSGRYSSQPISLDAIEEISVNVTPYDVQNSGFVGSSINAVTRSGTNEFSGSVYTYFRSEKGQGSRVGSYKITQENLQYNQYGFRFGGPIIKDKLFFFLNAETDKNITPGQLKKASTADNPFGGPDNNVARPTAERLNAIRTYMLDNYGYDVGPYDGYDFESNSDKFLARVDWNINRNHRLNVRYSQLESKTPSFPSTSSSGTISGNPSGTTRLDNNALAFKSANYYQEANYYSVAAELNSTFGGKFSNTLRASYTHQNDPRSSDGGVFPFVDIMEDGKFYTSFGTELFTFGNLRDVETYSFRDNLTWTSGKHNWTVGAQADFSKTKNGFMRFGSSYYRFASWNDFVNGANPTDFAVTYSLTPGYKQAYPTFKFANYSLYAQDQIALTERLKITPGLRIELPTYPGSLAEHPLVTPLTFENGEKINTGKLPGSTLMFSPRIGFNWDIKGDRTLQLRGGSGIFTGSVPFVWVVAQAGDSGMLQFTSAYPTTGANATPVPGPFNPDPAAYLPSTPPLAGTSIPSSIAAIDDDFKMPQTWKSSLALDARLPWGIVGTLEGIYNRDLIAAMWRNVNLSAPTATNIADYPDNRLVYPTAKLNGSFNAFQLENVYKGYYFSITAKLEKQITRGLAASVAYVGSEAKNLFDGSGDQAGSAWNLTPTINGANNPDLSYASYVVPHRVIASVSYRKEYLKNLGTTISLFYEGSNDGRFSYVTTNLTRDGSNNSLMYIPKDESEIDFAATTINGVSYTPEQQKAMFFRYIEQDKYLSSHKGEYAERNGALYPWRNQVDMKFLQDVFVNVGGKRNTLQFSWDVFNLGNLLNKNWGAKRTLNPNSGSLVSVSNINSITPGGTTKPLYRLATDRNLPVSTTFRDNQTINSTYYMQFGFRYIFN